MKKITDDKQQRIDKLYIRMAQIWAENSYCKRNQVGCIIVKDQTIISDGYNGTPKGFLNSCEDQDGKTLPIVLHAEANAILKLSKSTNTSSESTLYVTLSPCFSCSKLIIQAGIKRVVYLEEYRDTSSFEILKKAKIKIEKIEI
jgi:dCMP deaminase